MIAPMISSLRRTARLASDRPRATLWTLLALTCALFAVGVAGVIAENLDAWTRAPRGRASMVVYLGETVDDAHAKALVAELSGLAGVDHAELVPPAESARRLQASLGLGTAAPRADGTFAGAGDSPGAQLLEGIDVASLPASVEITLAPGVRDVVAMSPTLRALRGTAGVDDVVLEDGGEDRTASAFANVRIIAWTGAALFAGLALIVVLATVRVRLDGDRKELAVARMLGAGPTFFGIPTALAGALQGTLAAALAAGAVYLGIYAYGGSLTELLSGALGDVHLAIPPIAEIAMFVAAGGVLGLVGGGLAGASRATS
jgi:cell division transport system permease protein